MTTLSILVLNILTSKKVLFLSHEGFVKDPKNTLVIIEKKFQIDLSQAKAMVVDGGFINKSHILTGNRIRNSSKFYISDIPSTHVNIKMPDRITLCCMQLIHCLLPEPEN